jgi:ATP-dependent helicase HrpA
LLLLSVPSPTAFVQRHLTNQTKLVFSSYGQVTALLEDCAACAVDDFIAQAGGPPWDAPSFEALRETVRSDLIDAVFAIVEDVENVLIAAHDVRTSLSSTTNLEIAPSLVDARDHLASLVYPGFVADTGRNRLRDLARYVRAIGRRIEKLPASPQRDRAHMAMIARAQEAWDAAGQPDDVRWMIEELHVSLFAQELGTKQPVSEKRILRALD